jgi:hypothetical protein
VLAYLARYTHRVAISNSRLIGLDDRGVTFRFKDYRRNGRARYRTMTLAPDEFIRRFLLHVLPKGFHRIRHYGLLASAACKANIARAKELIAAPLPSIDPSTEHDADMAAGAAMNHRPPCPCYASVRCKPFLHAEPRMRSWKTDVVTGAVLSTPPPARLQFRHPTL